MVLGYDSLDEIFETLMGHSDRAFLNPASIDIRIGKHCLVERHPSCCEDDRHVRIDGIVWEKIDLEEAGQYVMQPGEFALVGTYETVRVPTDCAVDLRLKSTTARGGQDHALAFWADPGWHGVLTMEVKNNLLFTRRPLVYGSRFAQLIVHRLEKRTSHPYCGRYQFADSVEAAK